MLECCALLAGKDKAACRRARQSALLVRFRHAMSLADRHDLSGSAQPLFGLDHVAAGEPIFAAPVLAESDQVGRRTHRAEHRIILLAALAVPLREHRQVAVREGGLAVGNRIERSEEHTSELQSLMRTSYDVFCLKKKN